MKRIVMATSTSCLDYLSVDTSVMSIHQHLFINNVDFFDGLNISFSRVQGLLRNAGTTAMYTAPASESEVMALLYKLQSQRYDEVLIITHSAKLSESFEIIQRVKTSFLQANQGMQGLRIYILDCKQINFAQGAMVLDAERLFLAGQPVPVIEGHLARINAQHHSMFVVDDLSYLIRSKRLKPTAGFVANLLDIKPMLEIKKDGEVVAVKKVRKIEKAIHAMVEMMGERMENEEVFPYILNAGNNDLAEYAEAVVEQRLGLTNVLVTPVSPVSVATHGPNAVGFGAFVGAIPMSHVLF